VILGATTIVRWASRNGAPSGYWLAGMLAATALADKMARIVRARGTKHEVYRDPPTMAA